MTQDNNQEKTQEINELDKSADQAAAEPTPEPAAPPTPEEDRKSTRLNSSHSQQSRMPSSA